MIKRDSLIHKIRALMAKTVDAGCTEEEAMSALSLAQSMIDAYEVSDEELKLTKEQKAHLKADPETADPHRIKYLLASGIAEFTGCKCFYSPRSKKLQFLGLPGDVELSFFLLSSLQGFVQAELVKYMISVVERGTARRKYTNGFVQGCTNRISSRLFALAKTSQAELRKASDNRFALVVAKSAAIQEWMAEKWPKTKAGKPWAGRASSYSRTGYDSARRAGEKAGERASFSRSVGSDGNLRLPNT
jgi:hypothetical protein